MYSTWIELEGSEYTLLEKALLPIDCKTSFFLEQPDSKYGLIRFEDASNGLDNPRVANVIIKLKEAVVAPIHKCLTVGDLIIAQNHTGQVLNANPMPISDISADKLFVQIAELGQAYIPSHQVVLYTYYKYNPYQLVTRLYVSLKADAGNSLYFEIKDIADKKICFGLF
jgi:hypothetical protein